MSLRAQLEVEAVVLRDLPGQRSELNSVRNGQRQETGVLVLPRILVARAILRKCGLTGRAEAAAADCY